jgi:hypothetical protein
MDENGLQLLRAFDPGFLLLGVAVGFGVALVTMIVVGYKDPVLRDFFLKLFEAVVVTALSAFVARAFVSLLIALGGDSPGAVAFVWHFFLGVFALPVDIVALVIGVEAAFSPEPLLLAAFVAGGVLGLYDGLYRTRDWLGWGVPTWILDLTWGLALSAHGAFMLLYNRLWGTRAGKPRENEHLFSSGFRILSGFAFTQGPVISNWTSGDTKLLAHERIHVMQNRIFGPLFLFYYVFWLVIFGALGIIFDIVGALVGIEVMDSTGTAKRRVTFGDATMWFPYYNNPWEVWAYRYGGWRDPNQLRRLRWSTPVVIILTVLTVPIAAYLLYLLFAAAFGL